MEIAAERALAEVGLVEDRLAILRELKGLTNLIVLPGIYELSSENGGAVGLCYTGAASAAHFGVAGRGATFFFTL